MHEELEAVLDQYVRPLLRSHGGNIEVISLEDGILRFRLKGQCSGCPAADLTAEELIRGEVLEHCPSIRQTVLVQETSQELLDQARDILRMHHGG